MDENQLIHALAAQTQLRQTLALNDLTQPYGLTLTQDDARAVIAARRDVLKQEQRIELGESILGKIIHTFCDSPYLRQDIYRDALIRLQEIFFRYKNEMDDEISDDELLHFMKEQFDTVCFGDLDYLEGTCLAGFAFAIRAGYRGHIETDGYGEYERLDTVQRWDHELYVQALQELAGWDDGLA